MIDLAYEVAAARWRMADAKCKRLADVLRELEARQVAAQVEWADAYRQLRREDERLRGTRKPPGSVGWATLARVRYCAAYCPPAGQEWATKIDYDYHGDGCWYSRFQMHRTQEVPW